MGERDYKAFIVEGEVREPQIIDNISKVFFSHGNVKIITLPAGENIYMLWKKLKEDDFNTDIIEVLREKVMNCFGKADKTLGHRISGARFFAFYTMPLYLLIEPFL